MQQPTRRLAALSCLLLAALAGACSDEMPPVFAEAGTMDAVDDVPDVERPRDVEVRDAQGACAPAARSATTGSRARWTSARPRGAA